MALEAIKTSEGNIILIDKAEARGPIVEVSPTMPLLSEYIDDFTDVKKIYMQYPSVLKEDSKPVSITDTSYDSETQKLTYKKSE